MVTFKATAQKEILFTDKLKSVYGTLDNADTHTWRTAHLRNLLHEIVISPWSIYQTRILTPMGWQKDIFSANNYTNIVWPCARYQSKWPSNSYIDATILSHRPFYKLYSKVFGSYKLLHSIHVPSFRKSMWEPCHLCLASVRKTQAKIFWHLVLMRFCLWRPIHLHAKWPGKQICNWLSERKFPLCSWTSMASLRMNILCHQMKYLLI